MTSNNVRLLNIDEAEVYLPRLRAVLERNPEVWQPLLTISDVLGLIENEMYQLWVGYEDDIVEMFAITEVSCAPRAKLLTVVWCGGWNVAAYIPRFSAGLELFAKMIEADYIYVNGRKGWEKLLLPFGFEFAQVSLIKEVKHESPENFERDADDAAGTLPGTKRVAEFCDGVDKADND